MVPLGDHAGSSLVKYWMVPRPTILPKTRGLAPGMLYLVGTPKARLTKYEKHGLDGPWKNVRESVEVELFSQMARCTCR